MSPARLKLVATELNFDTLSRADVPHGRKGKHNSLMTRIFQDLEKVGFDVALKIPASALGAQKIQNIRAALTREADKKGFSVSTTVDDDYFYVWRKKR
jgi:hypothetical protein